MTAPTPAWITACRGSGACGWGSRHRLPEWKGQDRRRREGRADGLREGLAARCGGDGMTDPFGHHGAMIAGVCLDSWGRGPLMLRDGKRVWWFEFSDMFGPLLLQAKPPHEPLNNQPCAEDHPFWAPFNRWMRAGKRHRPIKTKRGRLRFYLCYAPPEGLP